MRIPSAVLIFLAGCSYPYPPFVATSGMFTPPSVKKEGLTARGAAVVIVQDAPPCAMIGLATGVGGARDQYVTTSDAELPQYREEAIVGLKNAIAAAGGTHAVIDATVVEGSHDRAEHVILRARAFRCG